MKVWLNGPSLGRKIDRGTLKTSATAVLSALGWTDAELSLTLTSDDQIAELAGRFGRPARATDVLAFAAHEGVGGEFSGNQLGDVVISVERADAQARERGVSLADELRDLMIHGVLHLVGMDHHHPSQARAMRALEDHLRWEIERSIP